MKVGMFLLYSTSYVLYSCFPSSFIILSRQHVFTFLTFHENQKLHFIARMIMKWPMFYKKK